MKIVTVSDGLIFIPESRLSAFALWHISLFTVSYEVCTDPESYPVNRRLKVNSKSIDSEYRLYIDHHLSGDQIKDHIKRTLNKMDNTLYTDEEKRGMQVLTSQLLKFTQGHGNS